MRWNSVLYTVLPPELIANGLEIKVGDTVEIANLYTNFSLRFLKTKGIRKPLNREEFVPGYDKDKFCTVEYIQRTSCKIQLTDQRNATIPTGSSRKMISKFI